MATEVSCGQCQGRLLVETLGVVVACPHCGTHLSIPAPEPTPAPPPEPVPPPVQYAPAPVVPQPEPVFTPAPVEVPAPQPVATFAPAPVDDHHAASVFAGVEAAAPSPIGWHSTPNLHLSGEQAAIPDPAPAPQPAPTYTAPLMEPAAPPVTLAPMPAAPDLQLSSTQQFSLGGIPDVTAVPPPQAPAPVPFPTTFTAPAPVPAPSPAPFSFSSAPATSPAPEPFSFGAAPASSAPAPATFGVAASAPTSFDGGAVDVGATIRSTADSAGPTEEELQRQKFQMMLLIGVGSYASCITLIVIYMLIRGQASNLESLPDLVPPRGENGKVGMVYNPPKNSVAPGHVLTLGQTRRFGNVNVTPMKVTRGPVKFEHLLSEPGMTREPTPPLLKLWVKFENVSRNQTFTPLDPFILFSRKSSALSGPVHANSFVATLADQRKGDPISLIYEMSTESEFRMIGQNLSIDLEPGEKLETFIPAEQDATELSGDMVWRFQFRKGYNPRSKRGVTTLIDVRFNSQDIKDDRG